MLTSVRSVRFTHQTEETKMKTRYLRVRTQARAGNANSKACYTKRDERTLDCMGKLWDRKYAQCRDNHSEEMLKNCLSKSGEPNWWKPFKDCTSATQCVDDALKYLPWELV